MTLNMLMACVALIIMGVRGNHNHQSHNHHHNHQSTFLSSFSHQLPGTNSYMSVTRYFTQNQTNLPRQGKEQQDNFHPWNPRFQIQRIEADEGEWKELLTEVFEESGLLGTDLLRQVPNGLVNLNYDIHICVHMGTSITPEESAYPPTAISYPGEGSSADKLHTLVLLDAESNKLHWMVVNIPGAKVHLGQVIATYAGPNPAQGTGLHRYIVLVMEQESLLSQESLLPYKSESSCENRDNFAFQEFRSVLNLSEPVAANYFTQEYNSFVDNLNGHCFGGVPIQPHPLFK